MILSFQMVASYSDLILNTVSSILPMFLVGQSGKKQKQKWINKQNPSSPGAIWII